MMLLIITGTSRETTIGVHKDVLKHQFGAFANIIISTSAPQSLERRLAARTVFQNACTRIDENVNKDTENGSTASTRYKVVAT